MQALLATMADWPPFAVYALTGALAGALGALIALPFKRGNSKFARLIPVLFVVISVTLTPQILAPLMIEAKMNAPLPQKIDDVTTLQSVRIANKTLTYVFKIEGDVPADFDVAVIKADNLATFCNTFRSTFESGFYTKLIYDYALPAGPQQFTVTPAECG
jgi:hypothetical protein